MINSVSKVTSLAYFNATSDKTGADILQSEYHVQRFDTVKEVLLVDCLTQRLTIKTGVYCKMIKKLHLAIQNKQHGILTKRVEPIYEKNTQLTSTKPGLYPQDLQLGTIYSSFSLNLSHK